MALESIRILSQKEILERITRAISLKLSDEERIKPETYEEMEDDD